MQQASLKFERNYDYSGGTGLHNDYKNVLKSITNGNEGEKSLMTIQFNFLYNFVSSRRNSRICNFW